MDRTAALAQLPETYAAALRLRDEPHSDKAIAEQLGITIDAVAPLLRLATAKLDNRTVHPMMGRRSWLDRGLPPPGARGRRRACLSHCSPASPRSVGKSAYVRSPASAGQILGTCTSQQQRQDGLARGKSTPDRPLIPRRRALPNIPSGAGIK